MQGGAIVPEDTEKTQKLKVGAIVLATGAELFDPDVLDNYGGGTYPNVVTGLEYERIMSASGPPWGTWFALQMGSSQKSCMDSVCWSRGINKESPIAPASAACMH